MEFGSLQLLALLCPQGNMLKQTILPELGSSLQKLRELNLSINLLETRFPTELGLLQTHLSLLGLHANRQDRTIPTDLSFLDQLALLGLQKNRHGRLDRDRPQLALWQPAELTVAENQLQGTVLAELDALLWR